MQRAVYEIFEEFNKAKTEIERKTVLLKHADNMGLKLALKLAFHPQMKFMIKVPEYKPMITPDSMGYTNLGYVLKKCYLFLEGHPHRPQNLSEEKMKNLMIQLMEGLEPKEAKIFESVVNKKLGVKYLTENLVQKTFPGLI
jgi:hypothetical protein